MKNAGVTVLLKIAAGILLVSALALWAYQWVYLALVDGKWPIVLLIVAAALFLFGLREAARKKADNTDYRRN